MILARTTLEAGALAPSLGQLTEALKAGHYVIALDYLASFQRRIGHIGTIVTMLRDWEDTCQEIRQKKDERSSNGQHPPPTAYRSSHSSGSD
jgi:hypothetical protein